MRIGTWNLEGKWSTEHEQVLEQAACDVWLLTEIVPVAQLAHYDRALSSP